MEGGPAALVPGVEGGEDIAHLGAAALAQNDPVGAHAQGGTHQGGHGDRADALDIGTALLKVDDVGVVGAQLAGLLDAHDALVLRHEPEQGGQEGGLAGSGGSGDQTAGAAGH